MRSTTFGVAAVIAVATLPLAALVAWEIAPTASLMGRGPAAETVETGRIVLLQELTRLYVTQNAGASPGMRDRSALAPVEFLNNQLQQREEGWRVRNATGLDAETFDIS